MSDDAKPAAASQEKRALPENNIVKLERKFSDFSNSEKIQEISIKIKPELDAMERDHPEVKKISAYYVLSETRKNLKVELVSIVATVAGILIGTRAFLIGSGLVMFAVAVNIWKLSENSKKQKYLIGKYFK